MSSSTQLAELLQAGRKVPTTCRGCDQPLGDEPLSEVAAYWTPYTKYPVHVRCKQYAMKYEAYECQLVDADCNDCAFFQRDVTFKPEKGHRPSHLPGHCQKFDRPTKGQPNRCTNYPCFEHRRQPPTP